MDDSQYSLKMLESEVRCFHKICDIMILMMVVEYLAVCSAMFVYVSSVLSKCAGHMRQCLSLNNIFLSSQLLLESSYIENTFMPHLDIKSEPYSIETGDSRVPNALISYFSPFVLKTCVYPYVYMCKIYFPSFLVDGPYLQIIEEPKQVIDMKKIVFFLLSTYACKDNHHHHHHSGFFLIQTEMEV